jgi:hypothetical protein
MTSSQALWPTQPPVQWLPGAFTPSVKRLGDEADHSTPTEVNDTWSYTSTPQHVFMTWRLIKHEIYLHGVVLS